MREKRLELIEAIQEKRQSKVICYLTSDRVGTPSGQISSDVLRPMYDHVRVLGYEKVPRIDLFLYSRGGLVDAPWPMLNMLREYAEEVNVLIPFRAHSAATLLSLGADHIVIGKKGELGPIDPIMKWRQADEGTVQTESVSVEDVMAFIDFIKERAGLGDQDALAGSVNILTDQLSPWRLGSLYRIHSHIRMVARNMLSSHSKALSEREIDAIIETLAEKTYSHGHAIGRSEARDMDLPIEEPDEELERLMWDLFMEYEDLLRLTEPFDPNSADPQENQEVILACVESEQRLDAFKGTLEVVQVRQMPEQLQISINLNCGLPQELADQEGASPEKAQQQLQGIQQQLLQYLRSQAPTLLNQALEAQAPIVRSETRLLAPRWQTLMEGNG